MKPCLLEIEGLRTHFALRKGFLFEKTAGTVKAVDEVSLQIHRGEVLGLVGESGCGKSTLARTIMQLTPATSGRVLFDGQDLTKLPREELRRLRTRFQMIFQDPFASLNPRRTVFDTLAEPMRTHGLAARSEVAGAVAELMEKVGLAARDMRKYPHEFSGGQRQRIAIARALAVQPELIVADEPVSALDVSVQAQILNLLKDLTRERGLTMILISHDLSVVKHMADRIAVMYLGKIVELGPAGAVFARPLHPYTRALISAAPLPDPARERARKHVLLQGEPPSPLDPPPGCAFHPRCPYAAAACAAQVPPLAAHGEAHEAACVRLDEIPAGAADLSASG